MVQSNETSWPLSRSACGDYGKVPLVEAGLYNH